MHLEGKVLVEIEGDLATAYGLDQVPELPSFHITDINADNPIQSVIQDWVDLYGRSWVEKFARGEDRVNCPEGTLTPGDVDPSVPTTHTPDIWYCKHTGDACPIQAEIRTDDKQEFIDGCNVDEADEELDRPARQFKEDIFGAVRDEEFTGVHHMLARVGCWHCQQEQARDDLHDPWALTTLYSHIGDGTLKRKKAFRKAGLERWVGNPICAECFLDLPEIFPEINFSDWGVDIKQYTTVPYHLDFS